MQFWANEILTLPEDTYTGIDARRGAEQYSSSTTQQNYLHNIQSIRDERYNQYWDYFRGTLYSWLWEEKVRSTCPKFDIIYVDGEHTYEAALNDILLSWFLLRPHGTMIIDDLQYQSVAVAVRVFEATQPPNLRVRFKGNRQAVFQRVTNARA